MDSSQPADRTVNVSALKALTHPLRIQLLNALSQFGPQTASVLAARLGESSGSTSYHLRQLAKHELVRELEGKGSARERWWERPPGALSLYSSEIAHDPGTRDVAAIVNREFSHNRAALLEDYMERGPHVLPDEWLEASVISTLNARLTVEQLAELSDELMRVSRELFEKYRPGANDNPDAKAVQIHLNTFPIIQGQFPEPPARKEKTP
ncbi:DNA-binding transcriptional ArsR family regulator [Arthrobacter pigmenti]|uniref:DNA-binding transcriptional ArsR family regulator n=1 Tax=Arthrobacter pigmenti TaxID=271432 RepID=A0A846RIN4_9MICC|nr:helix-turn-helix domain-containing protein [Arthrobacter pigmenti]NJC23063.1 DNA-binding transcriptional ArsR family regulator [Arthrobacter pigmenti]